MKFSAIGLEIDAAMDSEYVKVAMTLAEFTAEENTQTCNAFSELSRVSYGWFHMTGPLVAPAKSQSIL